MAVWKWLVLAALVIALGAGAWLIYQRSPAHGLPYTDSFRSGSSDEWTAYGGTWRAAQGAMRNESDERGAKLMTGSPWWRDYTVTTDVELLGQQGDAGVILRGSDEEQGVDSYTGYYVGLRSNDGALIIGLAEHGWLQLAGKPVAGGVRPFHWYRLRATVQDCRISAVAVDSVTGQTTATSVDDRTNCFQRGRVGIRSHSSGGAWKDFSVTRVNAADLSPGPEKPVTEHIAAIPYAIDEPVLNGSNERNNGNRRSAQDASLRSIPVETIASLKLDRRTARTTVLRGTVVLTSPRLYVQDTTGGAAVVGTSLPDLKLGDEVEAQGEVDLRGYSLTLRNAHVRLLWARAPLPPVAVTVSQAATGAYDATFIEVDGVLAHRSTAPDGALQLDMVSSGQSFRAVVDPGRSSASLRNLATQSRLRLRGVCVVDPEFTRNLHPFFLLVPSGDDIEVLAGPPWWSARSLALFGLGAIILLLIALLLYIRVDHWRLQAVLDERERIAHEMHDSLAQSFVGIGFQLQAIGNGPLRDMPEVNHQLELASELVRHSHEEARRSLMTLRREFLASEPLHTALERFARRMVENGSVEVRLEVNGEENGLPLALKDALFRIGQEAIANALRHGSPSLISIRTEYKPAAVAVTIEDNGVGFEPAAPARGFGLQGMRKRAEGITGTLELSSLPGQGTRVMVTAPVPSRLPFTRVARYVRIFRLRGSGDEQRKRQNQYSYR
ncbi:MAG TPA: sensor histidine kinase [Silvibacterium sp.]|nr:sensor histidine kinase [Silvibacterium sp.]